MDIYRRSYDSIRQPATSWRFPGVVSFPDPKTTAKSPPDPNVSKEKTTNEKEETILRDEPEKLPNLIPDMNCNFECTCKRDNMAVLCTLCGFVSKGRIMQRKCFVHPKVQYLMDYAHCPHCKCSCLVEVLLGEDAKN